MKRFELFIENDLWINKIDNLELFLEHTLSVIIKPLKTVTIVFSDDATVQSLNSQWRGKNKPTNILSFPAEDVESPENSHLENLYPENLSLGDLYLAFETIEAEALAQQKPLQHHLLHLLVHGYLHLTGHTHNATETNLKGDTYAMQQQEILLLAKLNIPDPYKIG